MNLPGYKLSIMHIHTHTFLLALLFRKFEQRSIDCVCNLIFNAVMGIRKKRKILRLCSYRDIKNGIHVNEEYK